MAAVKIREKFSHHWQFDCPEIVQANNKRNTDAPYYWNFVRGIHSWWVRPVMQKAFSCDVLIMVMAQRNPRKYLLFQHSHSLPPTVSSLTRVGCLAVCQQLNQQDAIRPHIRLRRETSKQRRFRCRPFDGKLSTWNKYIMAHNPVAYKVKHRMIYFWSHMLYLHHIKAFM